ncbi:oligosaccharide flippase family protein [Acinetobacter indicus]|uniref:oligosaccharide flippase family protein n=1 Tax=Acinetobacter indicus TaxID=756892 RepID=UPI000CECCAFC|nr:oligosaccharide flippase family protein [Acinetobacter indicus]
MKIKNFLSDSLWSLLSSLSSALTTFILSIIFANELGVEDFGFFGLTHSTMLLFSVIGSFGLNITILRYIASNLNVQKDISNYFFLSSLLGVLLIFLFIALCLLGFFPFYEKNYLFIYLALFIPFFVLSIILEGILGGLKKFHTLAKINFIANINYFVVSCYGVYNFGLVGAVYSFCFLYFLKFILLSIYSLRDKTLFFNSISFSKTKILFKETFPIFMQEILQNISGWILIMLILNYSSYKEVGLFNVIFQIMMIILFIPGVMKNVVLSYLSSGLDSMKISLVINVFSVATIGIVLTIFSEQFIGMYGKDFYHVSDYIPIVILIALIISVCNIYIQKLIARRNNWIVFYSRLARDLMIYLGFIIMVDFNVFYIIESVLYAYILANLLYLFLVIYQVKRI